MGTEPEANPKSPTAGLTIGWGVLTVILSVLTVSSLGTLAVITTIKNADVLSTVALALAVVSFAAQLIVTLAQGQQAAQLSADTKAALTKMEASAASLLAHQSGQFNTVLEAFIQQATRAYEDAGGQALTDVPRTDQVTGDGSARDRTTNALTDLNSWLARMVGTAAAQAAAERAALPRAVPEQESLRDWRALLHEFPSREEGEPLVSTLRDLSGGPMDRFAELVTGSLLSLRPDRAAAYQGEAGQQQAENPENQQLIDAGLIEVAVPHSTSTGRTLYRFTPKGVTAARILRGVGERPEWAKLD